MSAEFVRAGVFGLMKECFDSTKSKGQRNRNVIIGPPLEEKTPPLWSNEYAGHMLDKSQLTPIRRCGQNPLSWLRHEEISLALGIHYQVEKYSAFVYSCPLQTDTFLFPLIYSHNVKFSSNKF